jgi:hypothetical protein
VASRFLRGGPDTTPELTTSIPPERARAVHESCLRLARSQMHLAFQHALMSLEIVQAMTLLAIWKEPDDDKAGFYFNRAVVMAKELHLGRMDRSRPRSEEDLLWRRIRERVWYVGATSTRHLLIHRPRLCLFIVNTIFAMQFNQILQITHEDSLIANRYVFRALALKPPNSGCSSFDWHVGSHSPMDLPLIASVQLRARFLHYKSLLEITAADADDLERTDKSHTATLLSLSILTRTSNQDLGNINAHWVEQIRQGAVWYFGRRWLLTFAFSFTNRFDPHQAVHLAGRSSPPSQHRHHEPDHQNRERATTPAQLVGIDCSISPLDQCGMRSPHEDEDAAETATCVCVRYLASFYDLRGILFVHGAFIVQSEDIV